MAEPKAKMVALVKQSRGGISKKEKEYSSLEVTVIDIAADGLIITGSKADAENIKNGDLIHVTVDYGNPLEPRLRYVGKIEGRLTVTAK